LIEDSLDSIQKIDRYTKDITLDEFFNDEKTIDVVVRNFEIIGEAVRSIPSHDKAKWEQIEWRKKNTI
jgi:uncharacterized protein with HEPN domain